MVKRCAYNFELFKKKGLVLYKKHVFARFVTCRIKKCRKFLCKFRRGRNFYPIATKFGIQVSVYSKNTGQVQRWAVWVPQEAEALPEN